MSDKLKFVAGFHHSPTAESPDKLKFVGHFPNLPAVPLGTALVVISDSNYLHKTKATMGEFLIIVAASKMTTKAVPSNCAPKAPPFSI
jgi:hypothetical protein